MSTTIDQKVVEMRFDNKHFENNVQTSLNTLGKLKSGLQLEGATKGLENVGSAAKKVDMSGLGGAVETVGLKFNAMYTIADQALRNIVNSAMNAGKRMISALTIDPIKTGFSEYETKVNAIQTIMSNTASKGTTMEQVTNTLNELNKYADQTIYNFAEMTRNIGTFTAAGVGLEDAASAIQGIANLAAASGSTSQQASTAMYQLSQALSTGTVRLMDWNSVVNAGMGGEKFQEALKATAREHGVAVGEIIERNGSFRDSLQEGWLTADILNETLKKFTVEGAKEYGKSMVDAGKWTQEEADALIAMAQDMENAATKVKTFTQLWDTLKESAQSGWAQTWEIIVGDFEEAKETLTEFSKVIGGILEASAKARNELLQGWKDAGGRADLVESMFNIVYALIELVKPIKEAFGEIFPPVTVKGLVAFTTKMKELTARFLEFSKSSETFDKIKRTFKGIFAVIDIVRMVFVSLLGSVFSLTGSLGDLGGGFLSITAKIGDWLVKLHGAIEGSNVLGTIFRTMANVIRGAISKAIDIFKAFGPVVKQIGESLKDAFGRAVEIFRNLGPVVETVVNYIKDGFSKAGSAFNALAPIGKKVIEVLAAGIGVIGSVFSFVIEILGSIVAVGVAGAGLLSRAFGAIGTIISSVADAFVAFGGWIREHLVFPGLESFRDTLIVVREKMTSVSDGAGEMRTKVTEAISGMGEAIENSKFYKGLVKVWECVKLVASKIGQAFKTMFGGIGKLFEGFTFDDFLKGLRTITASGLVGALAVAISRFSKLFKKAEGSFNTFIDIMKSWGKGITKILDEVRGCFEAYQTKLKAQAMMDIAKAIAVLVAALLVLAFIPGDKLISGINAITALFSELLIATMIINKLEGPVGGIQRTSNAMVTIAVAVLLMASALKSLSSLDSDALIQGIIGVAGLVSIMVLAVKALGTDSKKIKMGAGQMVLFGVAIKILAKVVKDLAKLSWEEMARGLVGVGILVAEVAAAAKILDKVKGIAGTAVGIAILGVALKIIASTVKTFAKMNWSDMAKGLTGVGVLLAELALFLRLGKFEGMAGTAVGIAILGVALKILASVCADFAAFSWGDLAKGLIGMAGALAIIVGVLNLMPKNGAVMAVGVAVVSAALLILAEVLSRMGSLSWESIAKGLVAIAGSMTILAVALNFMKGTLAGSAAMLIAAAALAVLAPVLMTLGSMSWQSIAIGLVAIAGAFAVMGIAGALLGPIVPTILGLTVALALIGVAVTGVGAGLLMAGTGLAALALSLEAFATAMSTHAENIVSGIQAIILGIVELIPQIAVKIGEGIMQFIQVIIAAVPLIGQAIQVIITTILDLAMAVIPAIVETVVVLVSSIVTTLAEYAPTIFEGVMSIIMSLLTVLDQNMPMIVEKVLSIILAILQGIRDNIWQFTVVSLEIIAGFLNGIAEGLPGIVEAATNLIVNFLNAISESLPRIIDAGVNLVVSFISGLADALENNKEALVQAVDKLFWQIIDTILLVIVTAGSSIWEKGKELVGKLIEGFKEKWPEVKQSVSDGIQAARDKIDEWRDKFKTAAKELFAKVISGIVDKYSDIKTAASDAMQAARDKISEWVDKFKTVGKDVINGLINGIKEKFASIKETCKEAAETAWNTVKSWFDINSPSKKMAVLGGYVGEGLAVGIRDSSGTIAAAAKSASGVAFDSMRSVMSSIASAIDSDIDSQPTIRPVLDLSAVASGASAIDGMLGMTPTVGVMSNIGSIGVMMNRNQNRANNDVISAINELKSSLGARSGDTYNLNGIEYSEGDDVAEALRTIVRAAKVERRM